MSLRIVAYILNALVLLFGLLFLLTGSICWTVVALIAGCYNLLALRGGVDTDSGCLNTLGFGANLLIFIAGCIIAYHSFALLGGTTQGGFEGVGSGIDGVISLGISAVYLSAGVVSAIVLGREM